MQTKRETYRRELADAGDEATCETLEIRLLAFLGEWGVRPRPPIARYLSPPVAEGRQKLLFELLLADIHQRRGLGESLTLDFYTAAFPEMLQWEPESLAALRRVLAEPLPAIPPAFQETCPNPVSTRPFLEGRGAETPAAAGRLGGAAPVGRTSSTNAAPLLSSGQRIGDFLIRRLLGSGAQANVYLAHDCNLGRRVALKIAPLAGEEGETLAQLEHPSIVPVYRQQFVQGYKLIAMRYIQGRTAAELMAAQARKLPLARGAEFGAWLQSEPASQSCTPARFAPRARLTQIHCQLALDVAEALQHAHQQGILHRDIKPANILIDRQGRALLMDFHVAARHAEPDTAANSRLLGGTLAYMSPEHLQALEPHLATPTARVDARSDLYSLGVVLFELLVKQHPWPRVAGTWDDSQVIRQLLARRLQGPPAFPVGCGVAPGLQSILAKCLDPAPDRRYQQAAELVEDLRRHLRQQPLRFAPNTSYRERLGKWLRRHPTVLACLLTSGIVCGGVLALLCWNETARLQRAARLIDAVKNDSVRPATSNRAAAALLEARSLLTPANDLIGRLERPRRERLQRSLRQVTVSLIQQSHSPVRPPESGTAARGYPLPLLPDPQLLLDYGVAEQEDWFLREEFRALDPHSRLRIAQQIVELLVRAVAEEPRVPAPHPRLPATLSRPAILRRVPPKYRAAVRTLLDHPTAPEIAAAAAGDPVDDVGDPELVPPGDVGDPLRAYLAGVLLLLRDDFPQAAASFATARQQGGMTAIGCRATFQLAYAQQMAGELAAARASYGRCVAIGCHEPAANYNLALLEMQLGAKSEAVAYVRRAAELCPQNPVLQATLGRFQAEQGNWANALAAFNRALQLQPGQPNLLVDRATVRAALGDMHGAQGDLLRALALPAQPAAGRRPAVERD